MVLSRHPRSAAWAAAAVLLLAPAAAGCSSDSGDGGPAQTPSVVVPVVPTPTSGPTDPAAAKAQIEENWTAFFDGTVPAEEKTRLLENGERLGPLLAGFAADPNAAKSSAKVTAVDFTSATEARVTYDLLVGGTTALPDSKGNSVLQDGVWKVSVKTLCALVKLSGNASAPGC
ncbi:MULTISPECIES: hypothetical protein [unclassified Streptomyces]|uniref:hypothetical protein n=1 Tax=unclassified Streptomyces TaxID=2593676 RepID=UPI001BEC28B3|nr:MULTISPECIES: hypothetical protein [unclassified Streptomyces]MBT2406449.1 hypothetical protein [Streptomyces sp. ISL-21]MBT2460061.1 hypothetical protein [Streptomyces sp. ISL-86]MBT2612772.1 hypothetical protein [Streptomyces sp. ISL-87]